MSYFTDLQFLGQISNRVDRFQKKGEDVWICRCPYCGDSAKSKSKRRGYFFQHKGNILYKCFNCDISVSMSRFIKEQAPDVYREYVMEKFKDGFGKQKHAQDVVNSVAKSSKPTFHKPDFDALVRTLPSLDTLPEDHPAKKYIIDRKIPTIYHKNLFFAEDFHAWFAKFSPDKALPNIKESRIIIAAVDSSGKIFGGSARSMEKDATLRYYSLRPTEGTKVVFGLDRININKPIYVVEGAFDSFFLPNAIAVGSSSLHKVGGLFPEMEYILVFDADYRNKEICGLMKKAIDSGHKVVIWDRRFSEEKDINAMVLSGKTPKEIYTFIKSHTFRGPEALLKFYRWRKI